MIGRFISADTVVPDHFIPQSLNRYSYCLNNPIIYIDPNGHSPEEGEKWGTDNDYKDWAQRSNPERFGQLYSGRLDGAGELNPTLDAIAEEMILTVITLGGSLFKNLFEEAAEIALKKALSSITIRRRPGQLNLRIEAKLKPKPKKKDSYLYQKVDVNGKHLKYGKTDNLKTRYSKKELNGGRLRVLEKGPTEEILKLERKLHENLPIGIEENQKVYIEIQKRKGLKPPPY